MTYLGTEPMKQHHHFYGKPIHRAEEQRTIREILKKYQHALVNEELQKKIYDDLVKEKHLGNISIPFKVLMKHDPLGKYPSYIEIVLDSKV
jgi:hypothetical protein